MREKFIPIGLTLLVAIAVLVPVKSLAQDSNKKPDAAVVGDTTQVNKKEVKNRNVMLNADSNTGPRSVNIGLPFTDFLLLENELPVTFNYFPHIPLYTWKYDSSFGRMGLLSFSETAVTWGKVGLLVNSYDRFATNKFKGFFQAYTNNFGSLSYSASVSGPIGKKGWGYVLDINETYDHGNGTDLKYTPWMDRTEIFKVGITKKYEKGNVNLLYKHGRSLLHLTMSNPLIYKGDGEYDEHPNFKLGTDSYQLGSGQFPYFDANTGESKVLDATNINQQSSLNDQIYIVGTHKFDKGYKLNYNTTFQHSVSAYNAQLPISLQVLDPDQQFNMTTNPTGMNFHLHNQSDVYNGSAQLVQSFILDPTTINESFSHIVLTKKFGDHSLRVGLNHQYYENRGEKSNFGMYYQTVEANPSLLDAYVPILGSFGMDTKITNKDGLLPVIMSSYKKVKTNKLAVYFSDDAKITNRLSVGFGGRIEREDDKETHSQYLNQYILDRPLMEASFKDKWNHVAFGNFVYKLTSKFGFLGDITYNDWFNWYYDVPEADKTNGKPNPGAETTEAHTNKINVWNYGAGVFFNWGEKISLVSKVTKITKNNYTTSMTVFNPENSNESQTVDPVFYDIGTIGWTTDIVSKPFKNFNVHFLLTLQNPKYENYSVSAYGQDYSYDSKGVPGISKILMELDPSYDMGNFNFWASIRYFGKQYGNLTNAFYYKPWIENFAGVNYHLNSSCDLKLSVVNFLDQKGIKGTLVGADQIEDSTPYIGRTINAGAIRPRTIELTVTFKL